MTAARTLSALPIHPVPDGLPAAAEWRLQVDGLVDRPQGLALAEIVALEPAAHIADFPCEEGWVVPDLRWEGIPVRAVLERAGQQPAARWLRVHAGDFTVALPLGEALDSAMLAYRLDGAPLTAEHGAPLRLVAPGRACFYSVKWVDRLEVCADEGSTTGEAIARARIGAAGGSAPA
jgi:DMSO/TMAO reductase YedYZ molybdopterin-dependent catalytic subunit